MKTSMKDVVVAIGADVTHCDLYDGGVKDTVPSTTLRRPTGRT